MVNPVRKFGWGFIRLGMADARPHPHYNIFTQTKRQGFLSNGVKPAGNKQTPCEK